MYAPNGNPWPGPEVRLQARLARPARRPCAGPARQRGAGDPDRRLQRHPDRPGRLQARALGEGRAVRAGSAGEISRAGRAGLDRRDPQRSTRTSGSTPSGITGGTRSSATPASASTMRCSARAWRRSSRRRASTARRAAGRRPATMRRCGSRSRSRCSSELRAAWCRMQDSNPRPSVYKTAALPTELIRPAQARICFIARRRSSLRFARFRASGPRDRRRAARSARAARMPAAVTSASVWWSLGSKRSRAGGLPRPSSARLSVGAAAQLHAASCRRGGDRCGCRSRPPRCRASGSGSIGQIATLPSSRWRKRMPEKLALATCAAPIAS